MRDEDVQTGRDTESQRHGNGRSEQLDGTERSTTVLPTVLVTELDNGTPDLYRLNAALASLALRIMDGSANAAEQLDYAQRLARAGERLRRRATGINAAVAEGTVIIPIPIHAVESAAKNEQDS